jgi:hypothetical protein
MKETDIAVEIHGFPHSEMIYFHGGCLRYFSGV